MLIFEKENLPEGWKYIDFKKIVKKIPITGKKIKKKEYQNIGKIPVIDQGKSFVGGYTNDENNIVNCRLPVIIFGDHTKNIKFVNYRFVAGADGIKVLKINSVLNSKLIYYFIQSIILPDKGYHRHYQYLEKSIIPIPPFNEQKRIVTKIESIFSQIDAAQNKLEALASQIKSSSGSLEMLKSSVLKQAFEGKLVSQDPADEPAEMLLRRLHKNSKKELIFEKENLPKGWIRTEINNMATIVLGQSPPSSTYNREQDGLPFFQGKTDFGDRYPTVRVWCNAPKKLAEKDDILISVRAPVGSTNISTEKCCIGRGLSIIRSFEGISSLYVFYQLRHLENDIATKGRGVTFKAITGKQLRSIMLNLPPLKEQKRIVAKIESIFDRIDVIEKYVDSTLERLDILKNSVLKQAFEGKLVTQDPTDEPAEMLLQRIKQEKEQLIQNQKPSKRKKIVK